MAFFKKNRTAILGIVAGIIALIAYFQFFGGSSSSVLTSSSEAPSPAGSDLLVALGNLQGIKLDNAVFQDPVFISLSDFGVDIPSQPVGRRNPFAPLSKSSGGNTSLPSGITTGTATR